MEDTSCIEVLQRALVGKRVTVFPSRTSTYSYTMNVRAVDMAEGRLTPLILVGDDYSLYRVELTARLVIEEES
jgi:hypothetical protein